MKYDMKVQKCFLAGLSLSASVGVPPGVPGQVVQQRVYVGHDLAGVQGLVVPPHRLAAVVQQELLKVPPGDSEQCEHCYIILNTTCNLWHHHLISS